jgi:hypothetical protein
MYKPEIQQDDLLNFLSLFLGTEFVYLAYKIS